MSDDDLSRGRNSGNDGIIIPPRRGRGSVRHGRARNIPIRSRPLPRGECPPPPPRRADRTYVLVVGPPRPPPRGSDLIGGGGGEGAEEGRGTKTPPEEEDVKLLGRTRPPPAGQPHPGPLSLRLPASFLSSLPSGSRLELRGGGVGEVGATAEATSAEAADPSTNNSLHHQSLVIVPSPSQVDDDSDGNGAGCAMDITIRPRHDAVAGSVLEVFRSSTPPPKGGAVAPTPSSVENGAKAGDADVRSVPQRLFLVGAVSAGYEAVRAGGGGGEMGKAGVASTATPATPDAATPPTGVSPASASGAKGGIDVAELGRRTRRRADEVRGRRREIVRLIDDVDHHHDDKVGATNGGGASGDNEGEEPSTFLSEVGTAPPKKRAKRSKDGGGVPTFPHGVVEKPPTKQKTTKPTKPRRKRGSTTKGLRGSKASDDHDGWMPIPPSSEDAATPVIGLRSDVVRVHGLPVGTTPEQIRRFFSGLDVSGVFVLPPCPFPSADGDFHLDGFDAEEPPSPASSSPVSGRRRRRTPAKVPVVDGPTVEREKEVLRIIVRFTSEAAASLAVDRTGEGVVVITKTSTSANRTTTTGRPSTATAAVLVTAIPRSTATFLLRNMAIEAVPGVPLSETARHVETGPPLLHLPPGAVDVVWAAALSSPDESGLRPPPPTSAWAGTDTADHEEDDDGGDDPKRKRGRGGVIKTDDDLTNRSVEIRRRLAACGSINDDDEDILRRLVEYRDTLSDRRVDLEAWWAVSHIPHPHHTPLPVASPPSRGGGFGGATATGNESSVRRVVTSGIGWLRREMEDVDVVLGQLRELKKLLR